MTIFLIHYTESVARRYSVKNAFLKISQNSMENACARVPFLIQLQAEPATSLKKRLWHRCFPVSFANFFRTTFLYRTLPVAASDYICWYIFSLYMFCYRFSKWCCCFFYILGFGTDGNTMFSLLWLGTFFCLLWIPFTSNNMALQKTISFVNPFHVPFLYPLKMSENLWLSDIFRV